MSCRSRDGRSVAGRVAVAATLSAGAAFFRSGGRRSLRRSFPSRLLTRKFGSLYWMDHWGSVRPRGEPATDGGSAAALPVSGGGGCLWGGERLRRNGKGFEHASARFPVRARVSVKLLTGRRAFASSSSPLRLSRPRVPPYLSVLPPTHLAHGRREWGLETGVVTVSEGPDCTVLWYLCPVLHLPPGCQARSVFGVLEAGGRRSLRRSFPSRLLTRKFGSLYWMDHWGSVRPRGEPATDRPRV